MKTKSLWGAPPKRLYKFINLVNKRPEDMRHVCVIGASDGKFVLPMLRKGLNVTAIEIDSVAINGGEKIVPLHRNKVIKIDYSQINGEINFSELPSKKVLVSGLLDRVRKECLEQKFELLEMDFYHNQCSHHF